MKVAMVSAHPSQVAVLGGVDAGGQNVHVAELSAAIARRGHDVTVYTRRDDPDSPDRATAPQGYTVAHVLAGPPRQLPMDELLQYMGDFAQYLDAQWAAERPDVAHAHSWMSGVATQLAARGRQVPTVQTFHALGVDKDCDQETSPGARLKLERLVAKHATWIAATCTDELFELMRLRRSRARISVVPCGVDHTMFSTEGLVAQRGETPRIVSVGRLLPHKGFDTMIEALPGISNAEFVIVGGPDAGELDADPEVRRLLALAAGLGVGDRVRFTGAVARDDLPALLRSADVVTCTPSCEPRGLVPLEAMACGVAVVASAVGSMLDIVVHDVTGLLVPPRQPRALAEAVSRVLRDSFLRRSLGLAGRDRACARYSWDRVATDTLRIYDDLASARIPQLPMPADLGQPTIQSV
jgi:D-inositol-3-phosphate glycosyltransferase